VTPVINAMTVDVEDYFQVQAFARCINREDWDRFPRRVERNTNLVLDQFAAAGIKATLFTLGWVAQRHPGLVRRMVAEGHEVASHGWDHTQVHQQKPETFRLDVRQSKQLLEDLAGHAVQGYRAATFSITTRTPWAFGILREEGYAYSSSINPIRHDLYGMPDAPRVPFRPYADGVLEIPMTTVRLMHRNWPCSGGGYFRLLPTALYYSGLKHVNRHEHQPGIFYFHPWEIDAEQPRIADAGWKSRLRHYTHLSKMGPALDRLLRDFHWGRMDHVYASAITAAQPLAA
jgi:polysaccharide deacetylase family protein (PEP-CTERM system associated)